MARAPMASDVTLASRDEWRNDPRQRGALTLNADRTWAKWAPSVPGPGPKGSTNLRRYLNNNNGRTVDALPTLNR